MRASAFLAVLHQDDDLLVVNKPADLVCHPTKGDAYSSLISRARLHLGENSHPQLINRLDRETSGVVLIAVNATAARDLRRIWERRDVMKTYMAVVHGWVKPDEGEIDAPLGPDERSRVAIKDCVRPDGAPAITRFKVVRRFEQNIGLLFGEQGERKPFSLLDVRPETGRKHQIRIHLAHIGHPIVGDKIYGPDEQLYLALVERRLTEIQRRILILPYQALHASSIAFACGERNLRFNAEPEEWLKRFCSP
jgi:23S rRNA pseudouridine1911/1915/1917 synthase